MITDDTIIDVESSQWLACCVDQRAQGLHSVDWLTAVDRGDVVEVLVHLVAPGTGREAMLRTRVASETAQIQSLSSDFPGANWHERETAEMFGVEFVDTSDSEPLLLRAPMESPPLRRKTPLPARVAQSWPGAQEWPQRRRPKLPPGVREEWIREDD